MVFFSRIFGLGDASQQFAAIDASENVVRAARFSLTEKGAVRILQSAEAVLGGILAPERSSAVEAGALKTAIGKALVSLGRARNYAALVVGFGNGFLRTITYQAVFERSAPQEKIDLAELKNFLERTEVESRRDLEKKLELENTDHAFTLFDSKLLGFSLDGYRIADPVGLTGKEFSMTLFNTYAEESHAEFLKDLQKNCGAKKLLPMSVSYAIWRALGGGGPGETPPVILIGVGERETCVAVATAESFLGIRTFAVGGDAFTRRIALHLALDNAEAERIKKEYRAASLSPATSRKISQIFKQDIDLWTRSVCLALEEFGRIVELLPSRFLLFGEDSALPGLKDALQAKDAFLQLPFLEKPTVFAVAPELFEGLEHETPQRPTTSAETKLYALACALAREARARTEIQRFVRQAAFLANQ